MKNILFDFDGTLMNTWPGIENTLRASLTALDLSYEEESISAKLVGVPLMRVFEDLLADDPVGVELAVQKYRDLFPVVGMAGATPYHGVHGMLERLVLGGRQVFLVTARSETIAKQMMKDHDLTRFFSGVRGELRGENPDGKAHMVAEVIKKFGLAREDCVMIGDRRYDIEAARANNIKAIGVTYGYGEKEELLDAGPTLLAGSIDELSNILLKEIY